MWGYFFDVKDIQVIYKAATNKYFHFQLNCRFFSVSKIEKNGDKMLVFSNRQPDLLHDEIKSLKCC